MNGNTKQRLTDEELKALFDAARVDERRNYAALVADRLERLANYFASSPDKAGAGLVDVVEALRAEANNFHRIALGG